MKNIHIPPAQGSAEDQAQTQIRMDRLAFQLAGETVDSFSKFPDNLTLHQQTLIDLKQKVIDLAASLDNGIGLAALPGREELLWSFAAHMPDFDTASLYQKRASLLSIAAAVLIGWLFGGLLSALLSLAGLGGDILRPLAVFGCIWLEEWMSSNPKARRVALTAMGMGGLVRFASLAVNGMFRFTSFSAMRQAVFGAARPNIFKGAWLMAGALMTLLFLSKKITGMDLPAFRQSLQTQIEQRLRFLYFILKELDARDELLKKASLENPAADDGGPCPRGSCSLAEAVMDVMGSLDASAAKYLRSELEAAGFSPRDAIKGQEYFVWNSEIHSPLYETVGIVRNGDRCRVLKAPYTVDGKTVRGHAQRVS